MPSITQPTAPCHIPAKPAEEVLLGVDTHKDVHAAAVVTSSALSWTAAASRRPPRATATAKAGDGPVETLRLFKLAKGSATKSRTQAINQLKSVLVSANTALRESLAGLSNPRLFKQCADLDDLGATGPAGVARHTLMLLARRIRHLTEEIDDLNKQIAATVEASRPGLLDTRGVGPDSAAALLIAVGDNPERLASEASFAALCGVSPVEQSSGRTQRRRLNRGGDRQANAALYRIVLSRLLWDHRTQNYLQRRLTE